MKRKLKLITAIYFLLSTLSSAQTVVWTEAAPGVWKCVIGSPDKIDLYSSAEIKPNLAGLKKIEPDDFPLPQKDIAAEVADSKTYLRFPLVKGEQIYGFGLNFKTVHQRGKILQLHVDHYGGTDNGRTHAPAAGQKFDLEIRYYGTKPGLYHLYD